MTERVSGRWSQAKVHSTTQRARPRPEPWTVCRRAISGVITRCRSSRRYSSDKSDTPHGAPAIVSERLPSSVRVLERDCGCEDVAAVVRDQHVLLEAHAAEAEQLVDAIPVDAVVAAFAGEQRGNDVDPRLDRPRLARPERDVDAQARQAGLGLARLVGGR